MHKHECTLAPGALPAPAPLPSLSAALSRRNALFGALAIGTGAAAGELAAMALPSILPTPFDAELIEFAGRTVALAQRHEHVESQRNDAQAEIDRWDFANKPKAPELPNLYSRAVASDLSTATHHVVQYSVPLDESDAQAAASVAFKEARRAHKAAVADKVAQSSVPSMTKLSDSIWQQLIRSVEQLADMKPSTLAGLAAKASVVEVLSETDSDIEVWWGQNLLRSVAEDAIRLHASSVMA